MSRFDYPLLVEAAATAFSRIDRRLYQPFFALPLGTTGRASMARITWAGP